MFKEHEVFVLPYMFTIIIEMNDDVYTCSVQCTYSLIVYAKHPKFLQGDHVGLGWEECCWGLHSDHHVKYTRHLLYHWAASPTTSVI